MENALFTYAFGTLRLLDGTIVQGRWRFESDGMIGAYPRFADETTGRVVFLHAVAWADKVGAS